MLAVANQVRPLLQSAMEPPADVGTVAAVGSSGNYALTLRTDGTVKAWGYNTSGTFLVPAGLTNVAAVRAARDTVFALFGDGGLASWGSGVLTNAPQTWSNLADLAVGANHAVALSTNGRLAVLASFGDANLAIPAGSSNVVQVVAGADYSMALKDDGTVVAWGYNWTGQTNVPSGLSDVVAIAADYFNSLALKRDGTVIVWGPNEGGQTNVPPGLSQARAIACLGGRSVALLADHTLASWGSYLSPINTLSNVVAISSGSFGEEMISKPTPALSPQLTRCELPGPGGLRLAATGSTGVVYQMWATTNLTTWTLLGPATEISPGSFDYTDPGMTNFPRRFYQLRWQQP